MTLPTQALTRANGTSRFETISRERKSPVCRCKTALCTHSHAVHKAVLTQHRHCAGHQRHCPQLDPLACMHCRRSCTASRWSLTPRSPGQTPACRCSITPPPRPRSSARGSMVATRLQPAAPRRPCDSAPMASCCTPPARVALLPAAIPPAPSMPMAMTPSTAAPHPAPRRQKELLQLRHQDPLWTGVPTVP